MGKIPDRESDSRQTTGASADAPCQDTAAGLLRLVGARTAGLPAGALARPAVRTLRIPAARPRGRGSGRVAREGRCDERIRAHPPRPAGGCAGSGIPSPSRCARRSAGTHRFLHSGRARAHARAQPARGGDREPAPGACVRDGPADAVQGRPGVFRQPRAGPRCEWPQCTGRTRADSARPARPGIVHPGRGCNGTRRRRQLEGAARRGAPPDQPSATGKARAYGATCACR